MAKESEMPELPTVPGNKAESASPELKSTQRKVQAGFAIALLCLGIVGLVSYLALVRLNENAAWVDHTHEVLNGLGSLLASATDSETAERGYVITGDESYLEPYRQAASLIDAEAARLRGLTSDNPPQQLRLNSLVALANDRLANLRLVIDLRRDRGFEAAKTEILTGKGKQFHDQVRALVDEMTRAETSLLAERERTAQRSAALARWVILSGMLIACAIVAAAVLAVRRDFAGRAQAERALREANEELELRVERRTVQLARLASIVEFSDDAIASKDLNGIVTSWNPSAEKLFGYSAQEMIGRPMAILIPPERSAEEPVILAQIAVGESTDHFETVRIAKDGRKLDVSVSISPIRDGRGAIVGASKIARDISERKVAEQRLQAQLARLNLLQQVTRAIGERQDIQSIFQVLIRTLEEHLPVDFCCICLYEPTDSTLTVTSVGVRSNAFAIEIAMTEHAHIPIDQNGLSRCVRGQLVYEPDLSEVVFPFPQRLSRVGLCSMVAAPLLVESKVFGVLIAARRQPRGFSSGECEFLKQSSEHVALAAHQAQLYGALQQAYDDLRQTQEAVMQQERLLALGQMASGIAHDINNAISPIALYTESLLQREPNLSPQGRDQLKTIDRAIDDVAHTVARMREFYRQREPQLTLYPVDINRLVQQVVDLTRARWSDMAQQRGVAIEMHTELAADDPKIMGAEHEIRDALTNLIFNAVDAMPEGGPLTLRTRVAPKNGTSRGEAGVPEFVHVEVIDAGVGMDENTRLRCLEPFFSTKGERGTGLGLAMVYGTVQRHSADIEIESSPGIGTTMRLIFPVPVVILVGAAPSGPPRSILPQRILIVDDDPLVLKSLRDALEGDGHSVASADGGQAGIDAFLNAAKRDEPFPIVITDLGMPYVDGRSVARAVKTAAPATIVIMLTGWGQRLLADGDIPAQVDRVLGKPPKLRDIREAFWHCLQAHTPAAEDDV